jgi:catechol 2,3-dioxygenase-like lactoylglutathione lyase family enzyme
MIRSYGSHKTTLSFWTQKRITATYMPTCTGVIFTVRMDHVSLTVRDVDKSIEFYSKGLGLKLLRISVLNPSPGTVYKNAYLYSENFLLEIITAESAATRPQSPDTWQKTMRGSIGITHLGMRVQDLDAAISRLKAAGATMIGEPFEVAKDKAKIEYVAEKPPAKISYAKKPGKRPWRIAVFKDPFDGIIIELVER